MTICPGKHQADALTGTWERDLQTDVRAIADWGAAAVVTVMEQHELDRLKSGALGDAFGYEVEFDSWQKIKARFGETGITQPVTHGAKILVSDDTQMTLFTLEALVRSSEAVAECDVDRLVDAIRLAYLDWLNTQGEVVRGFKIAGTIAADSRLRHRRAPGDTCLAALNAGGDGSPEKPLNDSKGCGGVMRVAPLGLLTDFDPAQVAQLAAARPPSRTAIPPVI